MSYCLTNRLEMITFGIFKRNVLSQAKYKTKRASGLVVMTSRLQRGDHRFNSGLAHIKHDLVKVGLRTMNDKILFSLEQCMKCEQTKKLLKDREDITVITLPHEISEWDETQMNLIKNHMVFKDLQKTAPVLWVDGEKHLGYLRIKKWLQDNQP